MVTDSEFEVDFLHTCCAFINNCDGRYLGRFALSDYFPASISEAGRTTAQDRLRTSPDEVALGKSSGSR